MRRSAFELSKAVVLGGIYSTTTERQLIISFKTRVQYVMTTSLHLLNRISERRMAMRLSKSLRQGQLTSTTASLLDLSASLSTL